MSTTPSPSEDDVFLNGINPGVAWTKRVFVGDVPVVMKIDTGADVTAIPEKLYQEQFCQRYSPLCTPNRVLRGPDGGKLHVPGCFEAPISITSPTDGSSLHHIFVVRDLQTPLLGRPAISDLRIFNHLDQIQGNRVTSQDVRATFSALFTGLGEFKGPPHQISIVDNAVPYSLSVPRRVPLPLMNQVEASLKRMETQGIIQKIEEPTDWCAAMVIVPKTDGNIRICADCTRLNENIRRERHILPSIEPVLGNIQGATVFSKLDANSGFHQIPLAEASQLLTTFITPFGRFCYRRLPFGISSAPEYFQRRMMTLLEHLKGVICVMDDILVFGSNQEEHDDRLIAVLKRLEQAGVTLNDTKCQFAKHTIRFCGHLINGEGIRPNADKVQALTQMPKCQNVADVRRFLGVANQLGRFSPRLASMTHPLRQLLSKDTSWYWGQQQQQAFEDCKAELASPTVLAPYNTNFETRISADASSFGLGAVIRQKQPSGDWRPIAYQSRAMTPTEQRYSQIEKEGLAVTWACERFSHYLLGATFSIQTDHKPLVPLLCTKSLHTLPHGFSDSDCA